MERIKQISNFIDDNSKIIDVGCDHGYLGIELLKQDRNIKVISSDISKNALSCASDNIKDTVFHDKIELRCGNGLDVVNSLEIDTVVIAGMGSHTQMAILINGMDKLSNVNTIVLSPNDSAFYIRNNLDLIGYYIFDEKLVCENDIFYPILKLKKGSREYSYEEKLLGPILITKKDKNFYKYYKELLEKKCEIYNKLPTQYLDKINNIKNDIDIIEKSIKK